MKQFVAVGLALMMSVALAGCKDDGTTPSPPPQAPAPRDTGSIDALCDFFYVRAIETLSTSGARANIRDLASKSGVPSSLANKARDFIGASNQAAYSAVIKECQSEGWTP